MSRLMQTVLAVVDIPTRPKGVIKGKSREVIRRRYRTLKRYTQGSSIVGVIFETVKEYAIQKARDAGLREGYKYGMYLVYFLPGPMLAVGGQALYAMSTASSIRAIGSTVYNVGNLVIKSELKMMDLVWLVPDFILFGEYVPTFKYTPLPLEEYPFVPGFLDILAMQDK